jgi:KDO2-lipid IV(A) lauroyltransferase
VVELIRLGDADLPELSKFFRVKGLHYLDDALKAGRGLVMVTFHFGNWELVGAYISRLGYPLNVVVQRIHNPFIDRMISEIRVGAGMKTIPRNSALKDSLRALGTNNIVVFLADQDAHESGVFVPFFHQSASTPRGPAVITLRRDVPAVMTFVVRREDGILEINFEPIRYEKEGDLESDVEGFTRTFTSRLEEYVKKYPDQWLWLHRRWKTGATETG